MYENKKSFKEIKTKKRSITIIDEIVTKFIIQLDHRQRAGIDLPINNKSVASFLWLENLFEFIGESYPNINKIHLASGTKRVTI